MDKKIEIGMDNLDIAIAKVIQAQSVVTLLACDGMFGATEEEDYFNVSKEVAYDVLWSIQTMLEEASNALKEKALYPQK